PRAGCCRGPPSGWASSTWPPARRAWCWPGGRRRCRPGPWGSPSAWASSWRRPCSTGPWSVAMANPKPKADDASGRFAYHGLARAIQEKARLGIMTSLATHPKGLLFADLKELCSLTDGNLSRHLQVLHEEGLVEVWKGFHKKRPQTLCRLTDEGRRRFLGYI